MSFTDDIHARSAKLQQAIMAHPFVTGIGDGTLDVERFKHFIRQDYLYLIEYSRVLALASARAPTLEPMGRFAGLLNETLNTEMALHRGYCARFGITEAELEATRPAPTVQAYTDFLVRTAYDGTFSELACALLPCMWGYCEIGLALAERGKPTDAPLYTEWIDMYAAPEFKALADWLRDLVDRLAEDAGHEERERMEQAYVTSSRYEHAFWDMAYNLEEWKV
ncbi:MAG: thiaminase II [Chloroflexi bacterium]|nr:thiaminase II [Chloroflexota bacterium]